jgi:hypothetical protein
MVMFGDDLADFFASPFITIPHFADHWSAEPA